MDSAVNFSSVTFSEYPIVAGTTFLWSDGEDGSHLHFVVSDPTYPQVLVMNFTDADQLHSDQSCIVLPGEHGWVRKRTCVAYGRAMFATVAALKSDFANYIMIPHDPLSDAILARVRTGAQQSRNLAKKYRQFLAEQKLIFL